MEAEYWQLVRSGRARVSEDLMMVIICDYMKWDYQTYQKQPNWFIETLQRKIKLDNYHGKDKIRSGHRR